MSRINLQLLLTVMFVWFLNLCADTFIVTNTLDSGVGSLRQACQLASATAGRDSICFNIPTSDPGYDKVHAVWILEPANTLDIPAGITIDGRLRAAGGGFRPGIVIDGTTHAQEGQTGIVLNENDILRGLVVHRWQYGIWIAYSNVVIQNCYIGTDPSGTLAKPNGTDGILIANGGTHAVIQNNLISGNLNNGIRLFGAMASDNIIRQNRIGTTVDGLVALGNGYDGIIIQAGVHDNLIEQNLISGNRYNGIHIYGSGANHHVIQKNYIGTDVNGQAPLPNGTNGIDIHDGAQGNIVEQNLVSGNANIGIHLYNPGTIGSAIRFNKVGTDLSGTNGVPNGSFGIALFNGASQDTIGPANIIAYNGFYGVLVDGSDNPNSTVGDRITANSIFVNLVAGIHNMRTGNNELAPPVILNVVDMQVSGTAQPGQLIELFADRTGQGEKFLGSCVANSSGQFTFILPSPQVLPFITATATDADGNTSEFSTSKSTSIATTDPNDGIPTHFRLSQNYPNPFNPATLIEYQVPVPSEVELAVYTLNGQKVSVLAKGYRFNGRYQAVWNGCDEHGHVLPSGVYLYQLKAGEFVACKKMIRTR